MAFDTLWMYLDVPGASLSQISLNSLINHNKIYSDSDILVLKAVENVGVRHLRGTPDYESALKKEVKKYGINSSYALHTVSFATLSVFLL